MYIQQVYTNCLAHAAYYIESDGQAAVVDPLRNPEPYMALAKKRGAQIKYVLETHFHADFVSGHIDLAEQTGAVIVFGPNAKPAYKAYIADDLEYLHLGKTKIQVLHTPGHTIESASYLLVDENNKANAIFTGDTLFVGDVGRPDLLSGNLDKETLAGMLFESLRQKIKPLNDNIIVYPGHGPGSACGKNIGPSAFSTIGDERANNYAMQINDKNEFIKAVTTGQPEIPGYFFKDALLNISGTVSYDKVLQRSNIALSLAEFSRGVREGALVLDTRDPLDFAAGFIKGAINIGLNGDFAVWVGTLIDLGTPILFVADAGREKEVIERLARIGFDSVEGYLEGGMEHWFANNMAYDHIMTFDAIECSALAEAGEYSLLDVRNRGEVARHRMIGSVHLPLNQLKEKYTQLDRNKKWLIYCAGGYRSMVAASFLKAHGFHFVASIEGGIKEVARQAPQLVDSSIDAE